jgi:hypothetical protein
MTTKADAKPRSCSVQVAKRVGLFTFDEMCRTNIGAGVYVNVVEGYIDHIMF